MSLKYILLGLLSRPSSGYDLKREFDASIRHFWSAELSQIYPTLAHLEQKGLVKAEEAPSQKGPVRRVYRRTAAGRKELRAWLRGEPEFGAERFAYIAQLAFMHELHDLDATERFIVALRSRLAGLLELFSQMEAAEHAKGIRLLPDDEFHAFISLRMGVRSLRAKLDWCDECLRLVSDRSASMGEG